MSTSFGRLTARLPFRFAPRAAIACAATVVLGALASQAHATIQPILLSAAPSGPNTAYTYELVLTNNNGLTTGVTDPSALVVLDFPSVVSASINGLAGDVTTLSDWNLSVISLGAGSLPNSSYSSGTFSLTGSSGLSISAPDGADSNVVLRYSAPSNLAPVSAATNLLHLTIVSSNTPGFGPLNSLSRNSTTLGTQAVDSFPVTAVPEPASLAVLGLGAAGLLLRRRK